MNPEKTGMEKLSSIFQDKDSTNPTEIPDKTKNILLSKWKVRNKAKKA